MKHPVCTLFNVYVNIYCKYEYSVLFKMVLLFIHFHLSHKMSQSDNNQFWNTLYALYLISMLINIVNMNTVYCLRWFYSLYTFISAIKCSNQTTFEIFVYLPRRFGTGHVQRPGGNPKRRRIWFFLLAPLFLDHFAIQSRWRAWN